MKKLFTLIAFILLYNAAFSQAWKPLANINNNYSRGGCFPIGGKGYVFGAHYQQNASVYDTLTNTWTNITQYPTSTTDGVVGCSLNGIGYAGTGTDCCSFSTSFYKYDPNTGFGGTWTALPDFPGAGRAYAVMFTLDGKIYIGGGKPSGNTCFHDFYAFDPSKNSWDIVPIARCPALGVGVDAVAFVIGDNVYVGTGDSITAGGTYIAQKDFWKYDTTSKVWAHVASIPGSYRAEASAFATCDMGYVGLGYVDATLRDTSLDDFWQYNPAKDRWTQIANFGGVARTAAPAFCIGHTGYVCSGGIPNNPDFTDMWSYTETVTPAFTAASSSSTSICEGQSVLFNDTSNFLPTNWLWTFPGGTPHTSNLQNPVITYDTAGVYDVRLSAWNGCDSGSARISTYITVGSSGTLTVTANPTFVCSGQPSTLSIASPSGTYQWSPAVGLIDSTSSIITVTPDTTTTYTVTQAGGGNCASTGQVVLTVGDNTIAGRVTAIRDTICQGTPGNLTLAGNSSSVIQWQSSIDDATFTNATGDTLTKYKTPPLQQSTWYRAVVGSGNCSAISDTLGLYVPPPLVASFYPTQTSPASLSFNSDSSSGKIRSYHWDFGDGGTSSDSNPSHTYAKDSTYYVCLTLYDGSNCSYTFCRYSSITDGIPTISAGGNWVIYPNPFNEQLTISAKQTNSHIQSVEMYDVLGQLVINRNLNNTTNTLLQLDVSSLAKGMYYVMIRTADADYVQKVVKQ